MLQKAKSKGILKWKYLLLLPIIMIMLAYVSLGKSQETKEGIFELEDMVLVGYGNPTADIPNIVEKGRELKNSTARRVHPFSDLDKPPVFPGCEDAENETQCFMEKFQEHIGRNFRYPKEALEHGGQSNVYVTFTIGKDGDVTKLNTRMQEDEFSEKFQNEAKRLVASLPIMRPSENDGKIVSVEFSMLMSFLLR